MRLSSPEQLRLLRATTSKPPCTAAMALRRTIAPDEFDSTPALSSTHRERVLSEGPALERPGYDERQQARRDCSGGEATGTDDHDAA